MIIGMDIYDNVFFQVIEKVRHISLINYRRVAFAVENMPGQSSASQRHIRYKNILIFVPFQPDKAQIMTGLVRFRFCNQLGKPGNIFFGSITPHTVIPSSCLLSS
jgi:hypothetical protein